MHVYFEWKTNDRTVLNNEKPLTKPTISECNIIISRSHGNIICSVAKTRADDLISNRSRKLKFTSIKLAQIYWGGGGEFPNESDGDDRRLAKGCELVSLKVFRGKRQYFQLLRSRFGSPKKYTEQRIPRKETEVKFSFQLVLFTRFPSAIH